MRIRLASAAAIFVTTTTLAASAQQQPWVKDRRLGEGMGIRTGNLELHPSLAAEIGYDSNYFQRAGDGTQEERVIDTLRFRGTGALGLSTLGPDRRQAIDSGAPPSVAFDAGLHLSYNEFVALASENADTMSNQRHVDASADFKLHVLPQRPWSFDAYGTAIRTVEPNNTNPVEDNAFDRDSLRLGAGINWRPGGGLFEWRIGYEFAMHVFERELFQEFNNTQHSFKTRGRWRHLPRSALVYDGSYTLVRYSNETAQNDGDIVKWMVGHNGLITKHFAELLMVGWAASFYEARDTPSGSVQARNHDDFIAHAEIKWFLIPQPTLEDTSAPVGLSSIALGYVRDFNNSYLGAFYERDRGYVKFSYFMGGVLLLALEGGVSIINYPHSFFPDGTIRETPFGETRIDAQLFGEYRFSDVFAVNATLRYDQNINDRRILMSRADPAAGQPEVRENLAFERWRAFVGARLFW
jgi:hypothetical protein